MVHIPGSIQLLARVAEAAVIAYQLSRGWNRTPRPAPDPPDAPVLVLGTGTLHELHERRSLKPYRATDDHLEVALELGYVGIDTAAVYGSGAAEKAVGHFLSSSDARDRVFLIGKGGHPHVPGLGRLDAASLTHDLDSSLTRLRTETIDLYMLHRDDPGVDVGPIMQTLHGFVQAGKVRSIGASNWTSRRIEEANLYALEHGLTPFTASSPHLGLADMVEAPWPGCVSIAGPDGEAEREWYAAAGMPIFAWSPLGGGFLAGRDDLDENVDRAYRSEANLERRARARSLAAEKGMTPAQVGLVYTLSLGLDVHPIVSGRTPDRLAALLAVADERLTPDECAWLDLRSEVAPVGAGGVER